MTREKISNITSARWTSNGERVVAFAHRLVTTFFALQSAVVVMVGLNWLAPVPYSLFKNQLWVYYLGAHSVIWTAAWAWLLLLRGSVITITTLPLPGWNLDYNLDGLSVNTWGRASKK